VNPFNKLPRIDYFCIWKTAPRTKPKKGHNRLCFSDRYEFTGYIDIDGASYRVQFVSYADVLNLLTGVFITKQTHLDLYDAYREGINQGDRDFFSPVIAQTGGRIGAPALITRGEFQWLPYVVLSMDGPTRIEVDVMALEMETLEPIRIKTLRTELGGLKMKHGAKRRWIWRRDQPVPAMAA
jgi:hypothetical protein